MARDLVERYALNDLKMFETFVDEAEAKYEDPLEQTLAFLVMFEEYISNSTDPAPGCMYAVHTYESLQFDRSVLDFVADTLRSRTSIYVRKHQDVIDRYEPSIPVTARQLAELTVAVIESGLNFQRAYGDVKVTCRQSEQFRNNLFLLFGSPKTAKSGNGQQ